MVLSPHGTIDPEVMESSAYPELLEGALLYGAPVPRVRSRVLPGPEPTLITSSEPYRYAIELLPRCERVLIIGYSFGRYCGKMDDAESFEFFVDLLTRYPKPVVVADKSPDPLASMIEERIERAVVRCEVYWDVFAAATCETVRKRVHLEPLHNLAREIEDAYRCLLDGRR